MAGRKVEQLSCCPWLVTPKLVDEGLIGAPRDERLNHISIDDAGELIALLGEAMDVLA